MITTNTGNFPMKEAGLEVLDGLAGTAGKGGEGGQGGQGGDAGRGGLHGGYWVTYWLFGVSHTSTDRADSLGAGYSGAKGALGYGYDKSKAYRWRK